MPTILGANTADDSYEISNSLRFNDGDTARLTNNPGGGSGSDGSRTQFSISMWVKRSTLGLGDNSKQQALISASATNNFYGGIKFNGDDKIQINLVNSGSDQDEVVTDAVFRDVSAWYHLFFVFDKTQASLSNGIKLYVNGVLQTFGTTTYAQNQGYHFSRPGKTTAVGVQQVDTSSPFDGYMAEIHFTDGQLKAHTDFGETDDNGVWIPKEYTGSYGTYGFYLEFKQTGTSENSSGIGADTSGNDEHFAVTNLAAIDVTTDTPTNNFATLNPLAVTNSNTVLSEGNTVHTTTGGSAWLGAYSTLGFASGKWYAEIKILDIDNTSFGIIQSGGDTVANINTANSGYIGKYADGWGWWGNGNAAQILNNNSNTDYGSAESVNDIYMIAVDVDGGKIWIGKNGTFFNAPGTSNAGDPAAGTNPGVSSITFTDFVHFASGNEAADNDDAATGWNFGNAAHSISSGNADANGHGNFEYAVPSGFFALCTKNLAENG